MAKQGRIMTTTKTGRSGADNTIPSPDRTPCSDQESAAMNPTAFPVSAETISRSDVQFLAETRGL